MENSTTPLDGELLLLNQVELVTPTTAAGTLYGIAFTLFCLYVHALVPQLQDQDQKGRAKFMLAYSAVIMLCGLYDLIANAWLTQDAYIKHSSYPGGPYSYIENLSLQGPFMTVLFAWQTVVDILTSAIQIWRVWVIWRATRYAEWIIVLPSLCFLTWTALDGRTIILDATLPAEKVAQLDNTTDTAAVGIQGATTLLCTMLISIFLAFKHWRQRKLIGRSLLQGSTGYMNVVAILVESYALESAWLLIEAALTNSNTAGWHFFAETQVYIEIIAYLLVQYRVASGKAYKSQKEQSHLSTLHWNHSDHATTQFGETSEGGADCDISTGQEGSDALPADSMA